MRPIPVYKKHSASNKWRSIIAVVVVLAVIVLGWQYVKARNELRNLKDPQKAAQTAGMEITDEVGKILVLPKGETPTVANVADAEKLRSKPFFAQAQNGDKVVIYSQAKKAILYRPTTKQIVEIASYSADEAAAQKP